MGMFKHNATKYSVDLTGVDPLPEVAVCDDSTGRTYLNINLVGCVLGGSERTPTGSELAIKVSYTAGVRLLLSALSQAIVQLDPQWVRNLIAYTEDPSTAKYGFDYHRIDLASLREVLASSRTDGTARDPGTPEGMTRKLLREALDARDKAPR